MSGVAVVVEVVAVVETVGGVAGVVMGLLAVVAGGLEVGWVGIVKGEGVVGCPAGGAGEDPARG